MAKRYLILLKLGHFFVIYQISVILFYLQKNVFYINKTGSKKFSIDLLPLRFVILMYDTFVTKIIIKTIYSCLESIIGMYINGISLLSLSLDLHQA